MSVSTESIAYEQRTPPPAPVSFEQYLDWMDEDTHAEWVNGEIVMTSPAGEKHQDIRDFLVKLMGTYLEVFPLGKIISAPFIMYTPARPSGREPDLLFVRTEHLERIQPTFVDGPADLVVEITSPESIARDRGHKFVEYEAAGIPEYWLIDPLREAVDFYRLDSRGRYQPAALSAEGIYRCAVLEGFWIKPAWFWRKPLPDISRVAAQIGGAEYVNAMDARFRSALSGDDL